MVYENLFTRIGEIVDPTGVPKNWLRNWSLNTK